MDLKKDFHTMFELKATDAQSKVKGGVLLKGRFMLGRNESCDLIINSESISAIHAVIEIFDDHAMIYDMNSTNGIWVGDERIVRKEIKLDQQFRLADIEFKFCKYASETAQAPVLDSLEPEHGSASVRMAETFPPKLLPKGAPTVSDFNPAIVYPLSSDPKAEFSEYIFEDKDELYPIFRYEIGRQAVEVIILFKDRVFSIDYLDSRAGTYQLAGEVTANHQLDFPLLPKSKTHNLVVFQNSQITVNTLPGFGIFHLSDNRKDSGHQATSVELQNQDIIRLDGGDLQLFIRQVQAPPEVASAPFMRKNPQLKFAVGSSVSLLILMLLGMFWFQPWVGEETFSLASETVVEIEQRNAILQQGLNRSYRPAASKTIQRLAFDSHDFSAIKGSLELSTIKEALAEQSNKFSDCDLKGQAKLRFIIGASGHVSETLTIGRSGLSARELKCLAQALKAVTFPVPEGENEVLVTQVFGSTSK